MCIGGGKSMSEKREKSSEQIIEEAVNSVDDVGNVDENDDVDVLEITEAELEAILEAYGGAEEESIEDVEDVLFRDRTLYLHGEINEEETVSNIIPLIHYYNIRDRQDELSQDERIPIRLHINSDGGCLHSSLLIAQEIRLSETPVITICNGKAFSGGLMIFMASKHREMAEFGQLMFHEARTGGYGVTGTLKEIGRSVDYYDKLQKFYDQLMMEDTKITQEQLDEHKGKISDWFIGKDEAVELGIVKE